MSWNNYGAGAGIYRSGATLAETVQLADVPDILEELRTGINERLQITGLSEVLPFEYDSQVVTIANATGGTCTLTIDSETTSALDYDATAGDVETALNVLFDAYFSVTGANGGPWTIQFVGAYDARDYSITLASSLTGTGVTTDVSTGSFVDGCGLTPSMAFNAISALQAKAGALVATGYCAMSWPPVASEAPTGNQVVNANMELDSDWDTLGTPDVCERSTEESHSVTHSWKITPNAGTQGISQGLGPFSQGLFLTITYWAKASVARSIAAHIVDTLTETEVLGYDSEAISTSWAQHTMTIYTYTDAQEITLQIFSLKSDATTFYIDDVSVTATDLVRPFITSLPALLICTEDGYSAWRSLTRLQDGRVYEQLRQALDLIVAVKDVPTYQLYRGESGLITPGGYPNWGTTYAAAISLDWSDSTYNSWMWGDKNTLTLAELENHGGSDVKNQCVLTRASAAFSFSYPLSVAPIVVGNFIQYASTDPPSSLVVVVDGTVIDESATPTEVTVTPTWVTDHWEGFSVSDNITGSAPPWSPSMGVKSVIVIIISVIAWDIGTTWTKKP
jgi:hypothetical protein